jgi:hypothetical protein
MSVENKFLKEGGYYFYKTFSSKEKLISFMPQSKKDLDEKSNTGGGFFDLELNRKKLGIHNFPYVAKLSFVSLINHWKNKVGSGDAGEAIIAREVTKRLDESLEFLAPITNYEILERNKDLVELLLTGIFPSAHRDQQMAMASKPFHVTGFYFTPPLKQLIAKDDVNISINIESDLARSSRIIRACCMVLNSFYGQRIKFAEPLTLSVDAGKKLGERHFKSELNTDFVEIKKIKPLKRLSQEQINYLLSNIYDVETWLKYIPPSHFEFHGMVSINLIDVTVDESLSRLKRILLDKDAVVARKSINRLQKQLRNYFSLPELRLGLTAIDYPPKHNMSHKYKIHHALNKRIKNLLSEKYKDSIYEKVCKYKETLIIEDLERYESKTKLEKNLLKEKVKSILLTPLMKKNNQIIGLLELGSPNPYDLNSFTALKLREITPLFRTAMQRSRVEIDNEIEAIIREQYTALHPSVEWKFVESAFDLLQRRKKEGDAATIQPIVFKDVFPLYGQADIIGSSNIRNNAIQEDFLDNLNRILKILNLTKKTIHFPLADKYLFNVNAEVKRLKQGISSDDEFRTTDFIKNGIHPLFEQLKSKHPGLKDALDNYFQQLDPKLITIYKKRKAYEESVEIINNTISDFLEKEEKKTQLMLPHYFQKYKTDGVEYDIYMGQSLLKDGMFDEIQLGNMRLWQLMTMCEITRLLEKQKKDLPVALSTAQLILVHGTPLAIRFRLDEKQFDVDGAYNIRYAILKKRIDKALIEGTGQRLTQKGKVAIVYSHEKDKTEYTTYLDYLIQKGYITDEIEDIKLSKMQGVQGLKALRITVI